MVGRHGRGRAKLKCRNCGGHNKHKPLCAFDGDIKCYHCGGEHATGSDACMSQNSPKKCIESKEYPCRVCNTDGFGLHDEVCDIWGINCTCVTWRESEEGHGKKCPRHPAVIEQGEWDDLMARLAALEELL